MGKKAACYTMYYGMLTLLYVVATTFFFIMYAVKGSDCSYKCPLRTLNGTWMNNAKETDDDVAEFLGDWTYAPTVGDVAHKKCQSGTAIAFCLKKPDETNTMYLNTCQNAEVVKQMSVEEAWEQRCLYCDEFAEVYWPSITTTAQDPWLPITTCAAQYKKGTWTYLATTMSYAGIDEDDQPTLLWENQLEKSGTTYIPYPYGENLRGSTMCWRIDSAYKLGASMLAFLYLILGVLFSVMFLSAACNTWVHSCFRTYYGSDWQKLTRAERLGTCFAKQSQGALRYAHWASLILLLLCGYFIILKFVCIDAVNASGQTGYYSWARFSIFYGLGVGAIGGLLYYVRHFIPNETAFLVPLAATPIPAEETTVQKCLRKCFWPCCCRCVHCAPA